MRFSIITITFNSEKTIERTIKSVLAQTFKDYEYIIVDGASKDGTLDVVRKYEPLFEGRLKWKSEPDKGIYNAMNKGIERSSGSFIGIVNSDDWLEPDALERVNACLEAHQYNDFAIYCGGILFHTLGGDIRELNVSVENFKRASRFYVVAGVRHPATFVPKSVYNRIGCFDEQIKIAADSDFLLRCLFEGLDIIKIDGFLSNMSDGGFSNRTDVYKVAKNDRRIILKKNNVKGLKYAFQMMYWVIRKKTKALLIKTNLFKTT